MSKKGTQLFLLLLAAFFGVLRNFVLVPVPITDPRPVISFHSITKENGEQSLFYVKSIKAFKRTLEFLHIPKTAGSTIEEFIAARQGKIAWGMCRFARTNRTNPKNPCFGSEPNWFLRNATQKGPNDGFPWAPFPSFWHTPPHLFRPKDNPYQDVDIFTVIRDPVDRALSEFHFQCFVLQRRRPKRLCALGPTSYFATKLSAVNNSRAGAKYVMDDSHFTSQHEYIMRPLGVRQVDYVLKLNASTIGYDFNQTMRAFDLSLYWPGTDTRAKNAVNRSKHKVKPLAEFMASNLESFYATDYTMFQ